jgi:hypothetical protein
VGRAISRRGLHSHIWKEGMKGPLYACLSVVTADLRLCNHCDCTLLLRTRLHYPPTQTSYNHTYSRPHHDCLHHTILCTRYTERAPKLRRATPRRTHSRPNIITPPPFRLSRATLWSSRRISNLHPAPAPLHPTYEVANSCDNLGHSDSRKCSRHHKSK